MNVFVAGGSGTIGVPLVRALVARGHRVGATTRHTEKERLLRSLGATPVVVDALDADALEAAVRRAAPTHVIHQLTALPRTGPRRARDLEATNRLREEGTRNLLRAGIAAKAQRLIVGSFALLGSPPDSSRPGGATDAARDAVLSMESQVLDAARLGAIEGIALRYGLFYGPGAPSTDGLVQRLRRRRLPRIRDDRGRLPFIHLDDAVAATVAALDHGQSGSVYDIVDDEPVSFSEMVAEMARQVGAPPPFAVPAWFLRLAMPYVGRLFSQQVAPSNEKARRELGWAPMYRTYRDGLRRAVTAAARDERPAVWPGHARA